jgi:large subunit ribosomal protein L22
MAQVKATLSNYRQSPRKVRLVANLVRGKKVSDAVSELSFLAKRAGDPVLTLINSAVANAKNLSIPTDTLFIKEIRVDAGLVMKRSMPRARGRAFPLKKRTSHVLVVLDTENPYAAKKALRRSSGQAATKATSKKVASK